MKQRATTGLLVMVLGIAAAGPALGQEARPQGSVPPQVNAPMLLNLISRPLESPEAAMNKELRNETAAASAKANEPEVLPDGSLRYGRGGKTVTLTIRNPCPPGDIEHEIANLLPYRELPGRGRR